MHHQYCGQLGKQGPDRSIAGNTSSRTLQDQAGALACRPDFRLAVIAIWGLSGFFRVDPDELGVVLRPSNRCSRRKSPASTVSISACG
jgi:hypothetical protein